MKWFSRKENLMVDIDRVSFFHYYPKIGIVGQEIVMIIEGREVKIYGEDADELNAELKKIFK